MTEKILVNLSLYHNKIQPKPQFFIIRRKLWIWLWIKFSIFDATPHLTSVGGWWWCHKWKCKADVRSQVITLIEWRIIGNSPNSRGEQ